MKRNRKYLLKATGWSVTLLCMLFLWKEKTVMPIVVLALFAVVNITGGYFLKYFKRSA